MHSYGITRGVLMFYKVMMMMMMMMMMIMMVIIMMMMIMMVMVMVMVVMMMMMVVVVVMMIGNIWHIPHTKYLRSDHGSCYWERCLLHNRRFPILEYQARVLESLWLWCYDVVFLLCVYVVVPFHPKHFILHMIFLYVLRRCFQNVGTTSLCWKTPRKSRAVLRIIGRAAKPSNFRWFCGEVPTDYGNIGL